VKGAIREAQSEIREQKLAEGLRRNLPSIPESEISRVEAVMAGVLLARVKPATLSLLIAAGQATMDKLPRKRRPISASMLHAKVVRVDVSFDEADPFAVEWARKHAGELVTGISEETRRALRKVIVSAFEKGSPIEALIGLDERRSQAALNLYERILENPGKTITAGSKTIRVPEDVTEEFATRKTEQYADRLISDRADMIARTETSMIANEGQRQAWEQATELGLLDATDQRVWLATDDGRLCPVCEDLDGETAPIDGEFGDSGIESPPAHPDCRCSQAIA
jgi:SPP1 gp7 family putative phage head morphogenesis protein